MAKPLIVACKFCNKKVHRKPKDARRTKNAFCSRACYCKFRKTLVGPKSPNWKNGRGIKADGYVYVWHPTRLRENGHHDRVQEHRLIMTQHIGRELKRHEIVHHVDGNKTNNVLENLRLCQSVKEHMQFHLKPRQEYVCPSCEITFERLPSQVRCKRPYCSKSCSNRFRCVPPAS